MTLPSKRTDPILRITLTLVEYPILSDRIREEMRRELYTQGIINHQDFEEVVREQAIRSQDREGLSRPLEEEPSTVWETRLRRVREHLTDFYFATNLPYELFEKIVIEALAKRKTEAEAEISFNAELAPKYILFEQARAILAMPPDEQEKHAATLSEIKVVLIRAMISDQLEYVGIAKDWFTFDDLQNILRHKIGYGKIGGKAAGMLLAMAILRSLGDEEIIRSIDEPDSYFLGADLMYSFMILNGLMKWNRQKYKTEDEIRRDYPIILEEYQAGEFPKDILDRLTKMISDLKGKPLIVRSSSQLEDNFGTSFAGKYDSFFCPNQGTPEENLNAVTKAIASVYASTVNPDALLYRKSKGLQDYDERMAILVQVVEGEQIGDYYLPHGAGVAFSRNLYRWSPQINRRDGFLRLVWGLGTRAVDQIANDYPRLVALSHPTLRPETSAKAIRRYSQQYVDLIDLKENAFKTLPINEVLPPRYRVLRYIAQIYQEGFLSTIRSNLAASESKELVLTFDDLLRRTDFPTLMRKMLQVLERHYRRPVDMEFTLRIEKPNSLHPSLKISILQCRPQSHLAEIEAHLPADLPEEDVIFSTRRMVPQGFVGDIRYIVYVPAAGYYALPSQSERIELGRVIGKLNKALEGQIFICIGPGRWGTTNPDLGVRVGYSDIYNARALVEITGDGVGPAPEPSFGTHFFQDLMESNTYPLAIYLEDEDVLFNQAFLTNSPNCLADFIEPEYIQSRPLLVDCLKLVDVRNTRPGMHIDLVMDDERGKAVAFLKKDEEGK